MEPIQCPKCERIVGLWDICTCRQERTVPFKVQHCQRPSTCDICLRSESLKKRADHLRKYSVPSFTLYKGGKG